VACHTARDAAISHATRLAAFETPAFLLILVMVCLLAGPPVLPRLCAGLQAAVLVVLAALPVVAVVCGVTANYVRSNHPCTDDGDVNIHLDSSTEVILVLLFVVLPLLAFAYLSCACVRRAWRLWFRTT
jgi:hypothetical protein